MARLSLGRVVHKLGLRATNRDGKKNVTKYYLVRVESIIDVHANSRENVACKILKFFFGRVVYKSAHRPTNIRATSLNCISVSIPRHFIAFGLSSPSSDNPHHLCFYNHPEKKLQISPTCLLVNTAVNGK
jgi:hypothetical protein